MDEQSHRHELNPKSSNSDNCGSRMLCNCRGATDSRVHCICIKLMHGPCMFSQSLRINTTPPFRLGLVLSNKTALTRSCVASPHIRRKYQISTNTSIKSELLDTPSFLKIRRTTASVGISLHATHPSRFVAACFCGIASPCARHAKYKTLKC
jgi:hypothetical protein